MNRRRKAFYICLVSCPIVFESMQVAGYTLSVSIPYGFATTIVMLVGMHLGIWVKTNEEKKEAENSHHPDKWVRETQEQPKFRVRDCSVKEWVRAIFNTIWHRKRFEVLNRDGNLVRFNLVPRDLE